ncbi:MAG: HEAT repeat domain-containing protein [Planctomycetota bacterium]|jgi:hypothetical protein
MHKKNRGPDRSRRHGRPLLPCALTLALLAGACAGGGPVEPPPPAATPQEILDFHQAFREYARALSLFGSPYAEDWKEADAVMAQHFPVCIWKDDYDLVRRAKEGPDKEKARKELGVRGMTLESLLLFTGAYHAMKWRTAFERTWNLGPWSQEQIVLGLLKLLINRDYQDRWPHYRSFLTEGGQTTLEIAIPLARGLALRMPKGPLANVSDMEQITALLIGFGKVTHPAVEKLLQHENRHVRRGAVGGIGIAYDVEYVDRLAKILLEDPEWEVRWAAADALGKMKAVRNKVAPILVNALEAEFNRKDSDPTVAKHIVSAMGECRSPETVPILMRAISIQHLEQRAMYSLWQITGVRHKKKLEWLGWYKNDYAEWLRKARRSR